MNLYDNLQAVANLPHGWTSFDKARALASAVILMRPAVSVEIGVYAGKGIVSLGLAHREIGMGIAVGIDPWSKQASIEGQVNPEDADWWGKIDYDWCFNECIKTVEQFDVKSFVRLVPKRSDEAEVPNGIGVLRVDGNHGDIVLKDIDRFAPAVVHGGFLFLDDLEWSGGSVKAAAAKLRFSGWRHLYNLDDGAVFQKERS